MLFEQKKMMMKMTRSWKKEPNSKMASRNWQKFAICYIIMITLINSKAYSVFGKSLGGSSDGSELEKLVIQSEVKLKSPCILLMSSNEISVAQLPLIADGNISVVYRLPMSSSEPTELEQKVKLGASNRGSEDSEACEGEFEPEERSDEQSSRPNWVASEDPEATAATDRQQELESEAANSNHKHPAEAGSNSDGRAQQRGPKSQDEHELEREQMRRTSLGKSSEVDIKQQIGSIRLLRRSLREAEKQISRPKRTSNETNVPLNPETSARPSGITELSEGKRSGRRQEAETSSQEKDERTFAGGKRNPLDAGKAEFSDIDVDMRFGLVFASDSAARIHRFQLTSLASNSAHIGLKWRPDEMKLDDINTDETNQVEQLELGSSSYESKAESYGESSTISGSDSRSASSQHPSTSETESKLHLVSSQATSLVGTTFYDTFYAIFSSNIFSSLQTLTAMMCECDINLGFS